ncbi:hypothetical protein [Pseudomonas sp.]|uniref:hypothetical protein n=1 Tax=Pseudomonas sp. TaxID=306 RepID=UPI0028A5DEAC|nr:hypothetical protein [Pseudomonas sp.]
MTTSKPDTHDQGSMSATIDGKLMPFVTAIDPCGGVIGINDEDHFIYIGFPNDLGNGNYDIGEHGVWAYVGGDHSGEAVHGKLEDFERDESGKATIQSKFEFTAVDENDREIEVKDGVFSVSTAQPAKIDATNAASATFDPALASNAGFFANRFSYSGTSEKPGPFLVKQDENVQGGLSSLGALLNLDYQDSANPTLGCVFMIIDQAVVSATLSSPGTVKLTPGQDIEIQFEVEFSYGGRSYRSKGSLMLNL